ncbi:MAG: hypothetical protein LC751_02605 [Actinobacteria bacterium]|nr:hypothetical protein [Actinomycetota bacterium]
MPKKLAVLAVLLLAVLGTAIPALAQEEPDGGTPQPVSPLPESECGQTADQGTPPVAPGPLDQTVPYEGGGNDSGEPFVANGVSNAGSCPGVQQSTNSAAEESSYGILQSAPACARCVGSVLGTAEEVVLGGGSGGITTTDAFDAALEAAHSSGDTREAAASEEAPGGSVEETAPYLAAFDAAREAGADEETAREAALQGVAELSGETVTGEAATGGASTYKKYKKAIREAALGGDTSKAGSKDRVVKDKDRKSNTRERAAATEDTTTDEEEEVVSSEDGEAGSEDEKAGAAPTGSGAPLLMGGGVLFVAGLFVVLGVARSRWASGRGRRS